MKLHLDADAFFASVEQAATSSLRGKAMAVGGQRRGIIASASYEARKFGIYTPMPTARARKLCPKLIVVPGDYEKYEQFSKWMFSYAYDFTPLAEITSIDEGYLDLTGCKKSPMEVAETLRKAVSQRLKITISEGLATSKLVSQIASKLRKPNALIHVPPGTERDFLFPLSNRWLPGIGPVTSQRLNAAGLTHIRQIAHTSVDHLMLLLGNTAPTVLQHANAIDERPIKPTQPAAKSYGQQRTFDQDQVNEYYIEAELRRMADELMAKARRDKQMVRTLTVKVRYNDFDEDQRSESLNEPTDLAEDIYGRLRIMLRAAWKRRVSLRLISLKLTNFYRGIRQPELLFDPNQTTYDTRRKLADAVDKIHDERGRYAVVRGHDLWLKQHKEKLEEESAEAKRRIRAKDRATANTGLATEPSAPAEPGVVVQPYVPLCVRSYYSFLDSTLSPEDIVALALEHGCSSVAMVDTGNLHGAVPFYQACMAAGIRPIIGAELDGHILLVENETGYQRLCQLLSDQAPIRELQRPPDGLICIGRDLALAPLFPDAFYFRADPNDEPEMHPELLPRVVAPPIHYATAEDERKYRIVQSIRTLSLLDQQVPGKVFNPERHFPSPHELAHRYRLFPDCIATTRSIAARCRFDFDCSRLKFPGYEPKDGSTPDELLRKLVLEGARKRYPRKPAPMTQIEQELNMIREVGYSEYFLVVWDFLQRCKERDIEWITRGSAADSLVCYCLEISDVCPIRFKLYFQRFLNKERMAMNKLPDIDIDFAHDLKDTVTQMMFEIYGDEHTAVVGGFSTYRARSALADVAKVLGVSEYQIRRVTEHIPRARVRDLAAVRDTRLECQEAPLHEEPYKTAIEMAQFLESFPRHAKMHPCGVVVSPGPMHDLVPTFTSNKGFPTTHFDMDAIEDIGLIKIDILAQGGLAVMRDTRRALAARGIQVDLAKLEPWEDAGVWDLISSGQARGVHHIESPAMISLAKMCNTREIDTLVAQVSVIRPGAANESRKVKYTRRYQGLEPVEYPHPSLIPCLEETFGLIVYEEQVMQVAADFAGLDPGVGDAMRRALVKQQVEKVKELWPLFRDGALAFGRSREEIVTVWKFTCQFMGYAFCKAHSAAYGVEAYQAAWLKRRYPADFMAAVLTHRKGFYRPIVYVLECHRLGIGFWPPDINHPGPNFAFEDGKIRVPAIRIKGLRSESEVRILREHGQARFDSLADFYRRVLPETDEAESLLRAGAFDGFGRSRSELFWELQWLRSSTPRVQADGQTTFMPPPRVDHVPDVDLSEPTRFDRLKWEQELLGFPASGHPLELYPKVDWDSYCPIAELSQHIEKMVTVCGLIVNDRTANQVTGELMKFMTIADWTGMVETELFAKTYREHGLATVRYDVLEVRAKVEPFENSRGFTLRVFRCGAPRERKG